MGTKPPSMFPHLVDLLDNGDEETQLRVVQRINSHVQQKWLRSSSDDSFRTAFEEAILPAFERLLRKCDERTGPTTMKTNIESCLREISSQFPGSKAGKILQRRNN